MMLSLLLSRVLGLVRDAVMSGMFGIDSATDAYNLAFMVPDLLFFLLAGGALSSAFIPVFSEYLHTGQEDDAWKVFSVVTTVMTLGLTLLIGIAWIYAEPLSRAIAPGKPDELIPLIAHMSRILLPAQIAFFIGGLMFGTLYARQVFTVPGLGPNVYNLGIIFGAVALSGFFSPGVIGMSWGALIGATVGNLLIPLLVMRKLQSKFSPSLDLSHPGVKKVFRLMLPVVLGLSLPGVYAMIVQWFGSFYSEGINTALKYANNLMLAPVGIFGQSLAIGAFPALSQFFAQGKMDLFRDTVAKTMRTVIYISVPVTAILLALGPEIVQSIYQHGDFTAKDTAQVAQMLALFGVGIFAWCLHPVLMRSFFAYHNTWLPILMGTGTTVVFVGLVVAFRATALGPSALPIASSVSAVLLVIALTLGLRAKVGPFGVGGVLTTFLKSAIASGLVGGALYLVAILLRPEAGFGKVAALALAGVGGLAGVWAYFFLTKFLQMPETQYLARALNRRTAPNIRE